MIDNSTQVQLEQVSALFREFIDLNACTRDQLIALMTAMGNYQAGRALAVTAEMGAKHRLAMAAEFCKSGEEALAVAFGNGAPHA